MELFKATSQWSTRPADQRFKTLESLYQATHEYRVQAATAKASWDSLRVEADGKEVKLTGKTGVPAQLTHWAFGQLCSKVQAPASYLRDLPATLAAQNLNHGLARKADATEAQLMFHRNGSLLLRAVTSDQYRRIWNSEIAERLVGMQQFGWQPAKPTTHWGSESVGKCIMCSGTGNDGKCMYCAGTGEEYPALYASDHDMFAFLYNLQYVVREPGNSDGLKRGIIVENSEVGASALRFTKFLFREMCGNHIIWGASKVMEISLRHVGDVRERFETYQLELKKYAESSASDDEAVISRARTKVLGKTKEEVLDLLFGKRLQLSRKQLEAGYDAVKPEQDGDPNTVWGVVQGITRHSQTVPFADERTAMDRAAGKIMEIAF